MIKYLQTIPTWLDTMVFWIIILVVVVIVVNSLCIKKEKPKAPDTKDGDTPPVPKPKDKPGKKKDESKATFMDFVITIIFIAFTAFIISIFTGKTEVPFLKYFGVKETPKPRVETVVPERKPPAEKGKVWKLTWQKPADVSGTTPQKRRCCFEIKFLRRDSNILEFISMINGIPSGGTHAFLTTENQKVGRKWKGTYRDEKTKETGIIGFDEFPDKDGEIMYIGEQSDGLKNPEWIPTVIQQKTE